MYTSDDRGILFSKSLERHLFDGQRKSDFTNITSLRGVYLTNKLDEGRVGGGLQTHVSRRLTPVQQQNTEQRFMSQMAV